MRYVIFPLGNPGKEYEYTRHNAARVAISDIKIDEINAEIKIPDCYMNESGKFIKNYIKYNNGVVPVVMYDDIDLELSKIKISFGRSSGGHNGVQNVIDELGTEDFIRVRVGIGSKPHKDMLLQDYVISKLSKNEIEELKKLSNKLTDIIITIVNVGVEKAMERYN